MNFDKSLMKNYGLKLHKEEENFDNEYFECSKRTVEHPEYGSQDSNNVETKVKPSSMHRQTVAFTMRENPGLLESSSGGSGSSNPSSIASEKEVHLHQKEIYREDRIWDYNFWMINVQKTLRRYSHLQVRMIRHHGESKRKVYTRSFDEDSCEVSYELGGVTLPVLRRRLGRNSCMRIDCIASTAEDSKQDFEICKNADKE